jgi:hypothetical protein
MEQVQNKNLGNLLTSEMQQLSFRTFMGLRVSHFVVTRSVQRAGFKVDRGLIINLLKPTGCVMHQQV